MFRSRLFLPPGAKGRDLSQRDFSAAVTYCTAVNLHSVHISERLLVREIQHRATTFVVHDLVPTLCLLLSSITIISRVRHIRSHASQRFIGASFFCATHGLTYISLHSFPSYDNAKSIPQMDQLLTGHAHMHQLVVPCGDLRRYQPFAQCRVGSEAGHAVSPNAGYCAHQHLPIPFRCRALAARRGI